MADESDSHSFSLLISSALSMSTRWRLYDARITRSSSRSTEQTFGDRLRQTFHYLRYEALPSSCLSVNTILSQNYSIGPFSRNVVGPCL